MSDSVSLGNTSHFWRIVALRNDCNAPFRKTKEWPVPSLEKIENHRDQWSTAGEQADNVAQYLQDCLDRLSDGWKGKGAKAFTKKVDQVIYFARKLAYQCDAEKYSDPPAPQDDEESASGPQAPTETSGSGYVQIWDEILAGLRDAKNEETNPTYPWCKEQYTMEAYPRDWNPGLAYYFRRDGEEIEIPGHGDCVNEADLWSEYNKIWGGSSPDDLVPQHLVDQVTEDRSNSQVTEDADGQWSYHNAFFPVDDKHYEELFVHLKLNKDEAETSRDTIAAMLEKYAAVSEEPDAPEAPQLFSDPSDEGAGTGSSGGAPGESGSPMGGGPSSPTTGGGPEPDDMGPDSDRISGEPRPQDTNEQQDTLDRRGPSGPGDSPGPGSPEKPGGPGDNIGFPGPDERDTGTETARVGGDGPGALGGGPGTGAAGGGPGGAGGNSVPTAPGAGAPSTSGGMGAGGAGAGRMGGGMMPMMGGGMGGGGGEGGDEGDRDTWLDEDEDVWGIHSDAPPAILGGSL